MHLLNVKVSEFSPFPMPSVFNFISSSRNAPHLSASIRISSTLNKLRCLTLSTSSSAAPVSLSDSPNELSFRVSYLINSCGLAPELALSKARRLPFRTPEKPDAVLAFLKKHGFTKTQISKLIGKLPRILCFEIEKNILPKFKILSSLGLSSEEITIIISKAPYILERSFEKVIIPSFNILRNLLESDDVTVDTIRRYPNVLASKPDEENIATLRQAGVPPENIVFLLKSRQTGFRISPEDFKKVVELVKEMGFHPSRTKFVIAVLVIMSVRKSTWDRKVQVLKKYGWSDHDILLAFKKSPSYILSSEDRMMAVMDILVNQMGVDATSLIDNPDIFRLSLEKSIVPRCLIYQALLEKELSRKVRKIKITSLLGVSKKIFFISVVKPYKDEAPEVMPLYQKMSES